MPFQEINIEEIVEGKIKEDEKFANLLMARRNEKELIDMIVKIRKELGLTQLDLSVLLGCSQQEVSRMESDKHSPTLKTICQVVDVMGYELVLKKKE